MRSFSLKFQHIWTINDRDISIWSSVNKIETACTNSISSWIQNIYKHSSNFTLTTETFWTTSLQTFPLQQLSMFGKFWNSLNTSGLLDKLPTFESHLSFISFAKSSRWQGLYHRRPCGTRAPRCSLSWGRPCWGCRPRPGCPRRCSSSVSS